jgi:hypothetical protein
MLYMFLKSKKNLKDIQLMFKEVHPGKPTIAINETHIIAMTTCGGLGRAPHI